MHCNRECFAMNRRSQKFIFYLKCFLYMVSYPNMILQRYYHLIRSPMKCAVNPKCFNKCIYLIQVCGHSNSVMTNHLHKKYYSVELSRVKLFNVSQVLSGHVCSRNVQIFMQAFCMD